MKYFFQIIRFSYFTPRAYQVSVVIIAMYVLAYFFPIIFPFATIFFYAYMLAVFLDAVLLFWNKNGMEGFRHVPERLSNGDENEIKGHLVSRYGFPVSGELIDELPAPFQCRDFEISFSIPAGETSSFSYMLIPKKRGEYVFGSLNAYVKSPIGLVQRRFKWKLELTVPVYPSFIQMRKYEMIAAHHQLVNSGIKRIRKIGQSTEFEQIKEYVYGDDIRTLNYKASARRDKWMVNKYEEERSQPVICCVDGGRNMFMPFEGMALVDYAINAALVLANVAWIKQDKPGLLTFSKTVEAFIPPERRGTQMARIMEVLYKQQHGQVESNFEQVYGFLRQRWNQRSLLLFFTNFESISAAKRQLPFFRRMAKFHLVVVIIFENTEIQSLLLQPAANTFEVYRKSIASKFDLEKRLISRLFAAYGIQVIYTPPQKLTVNTINKYLELKSRNLI